MRQRQYQHMLEKRLTAEFRSLLLPNGNGARARTEAAKKPLPGGGVASAGGVEPQLRQ
jgi:hypothetical protein